MRWYSDFGGVRAAQIAGDVVAVVVLAAGIAAGAALHGAIAALEGFGARVASSGDGLRRTLSGIGQQLGGIPFIGGGIRSPFDAASGAGSTLADAGRQYQAVVERVATIAGWTVALLAVLLVLAGWVRPRVAGAVRRGAAARLLRQGTDLELLALKALAGRPAAEIARIDPRAAARWRAGDPDVVRALAALELRGAGLKPPT